MSMRFVCMILTAWWFWTPMTLPVPFSLKDSPSFLWAQPPAPPTPLPSSNTSPTSETPAPSTLELQARKDLEELRKRPDEFRVLVMGVQIFLGRFGYGTGPYTGDLDDTTRKALRAYQRYVGLPETGDIDYPTLKHLTDDNKTLDQPVPFLPQASFHLDQWEQAIQIQGTWARPDAPTTDAIQTSRLSCFKEHKQCIESTALLLQGAVPVLEVLTHVYAVKEWNEEQLVTEPYDGEPCTVTILRIHRTKKAATRFSAYHQGEGLCAKVQTQDVQYQLVTGPQVYHRLKQHKAEETQRILRVKD